MPIIIEDRTIGEPLNHARIGYDNFVREAVVTATSEKSGFPSSAIKTPVTYEFWASNDQVSTLSITFPESKLIDYIAFGAQELKADITIKNGSSVVYEYSADGKQEAILFLLKKRSYTTINIEIDSSSYGELPGYLGVVYAGKILEMKRPFFSDHSPMRLSRKTKISNNKSESGQFLGKSIINQGFKASYNWNNLPGKWYRENFDLFVEEARKYPFFIAWNPLRYENDVFFCSVNSDIEPKYNGIKDFMSVGFVADGIE